MNKDMMRRVREHVLANPEHLEMDTWFSFPTVQHRELTMPLDVLEQFGPEAAGWLLTDAGTPASSHIHCGYAACLAGTAVVLAYADEQFPNGRPEQESNWFQAGADALGLDSTQASRLFHTDSWPGWAFEEDGDGHLQEEFIDGHTEATMAALLLQLMIDDEDPWSIFTAPFLAASWLASPNHASSPAAVVVTLDESGDDLDFDHGFNDFNDINEGD